MADEQYELRRINWTQVLSFTHIFKSFEMARHPSKLLLALMAIVGVFCLGWVMDGFWALGGQTVFRGEIYAHFSKPLWQFDKEQQRWKDGRVNRAAALVSQAETQKYHLNNYRFRLPTGPLKDAFEKELAKSNEGVQLASRSLDDIEKDRSYGDLLGEADEFFDEELDRIAAILPVAKKEAKKEIRAISDTEQKDKALEKYEEDLPIAYQQITALKVKFASDVLDARGDRIFRSLADYGRQCLANAFTAVRYGNIFGGLSEYRAVLSAKAVPPQAVQTAQTVNPPAPVPVNERAGFFYWVLLALHALCWLIRTHWVYALVFLPLSLAMAALFGGAIHRIAALHFAREEKISILQAIRFSLSKFPSFFTAPLIVLAIVLILGLILTLGGLVGSIPFVGDVLMGLLFFAFALPLMLLS